MSKKVLNHEIHEKHEMKKGVVPKLRFPEFRGKEGWEKTKIGTYLTESRIRGNSGDTAKKLTVKLWGNGVFEKKESLKGSENTQYFKRKSGQFIYSKLDFLNQAFGVIPAHLDGYESTVDLPCFDSNSNADVRFFLEYVKRDDFYKKFGEIADGGRIAKRIQAETFLEFPVFIPHLPEQSRIADCLSSLDALIAAHSQKLDGLKSYKKGLMQQLFPAKGEKVPKLRFPEFRGKGEWEEKMLGEISTFYNGRAYKQEELLECGKYRVLRVGNFFTNNSWYYSDLELEDNKYCDKGDLLYAWSASFGPRIWQEEKVIYHYHIWKVVENMDVCKEFLFILLDYETERMKASSANGLGMMHITKGSIESWKCSIPKFKEQLRIASFLSSIDNRITAQTQKIEALKAHKKGLMQQLFPTMYEANA